MQLNKSHFRNKISYPPSDEDSDDSEGENQELAQIDRERRRNCTLTPLATNQLQNQENQCCKVRALIHAGLDRHSSEEELERISREFAAEKRKWSQVSRLACCGDGNNASSSDEEVKNLCAMSCRPAAERGDGLHASPSPVLFSASPPKRLQPLVRSPAPGSLILTSVGAGLEQVMPCKRHRQGYGDKVSRPSLDLEKMQQSIKRKARNKEETEEEQKKMLLKKNCGAKTRVIKIRSMIFTGTLDCLCILLHLLTSLTFNLTCSVPIVLAVPWEVSLPYTLAPEEDPERNHSTAFHPKPERQRRPPAAPLYV
ncbi:hypothetical protein RLOC_00003120 [Lonchura striata]|uniref:Uncharacterized protein n=1 Tax=Lonchura striata TaxID=40157 RepID=A0A218UVF5_9PASE|nr:hypothetical protein RLOC_00003120 [Lonchura striata domestica]